MTLAHVLFCEFCEIFKKILFTDQLWATASDSGLKKRQIHTFTIINNISRYIPICWDYF